MLSSDFLISDSLKMTHTFNTISKNILDRLTVDVPSYYTYHSVNHTKYVLKMAEYLAQKQGIADHELLLLKVAALYHDIGFTVSHIEHEAVGCTIVRSELPSYDFSLSDIEKVCGMIMATKIPQKPQNFLEEILADADLEYLSTESFKPVGLMLYNEMKHFDSNLTLDDFDKIQINFLENHQYFTPFCIKHKENFKQQHLLKLKAKQLKAQ
jgi:uncharacterized protein